MKRPFCKKCNKKPCAVNYKRKGITYYRSICDTCRDNIPVHKRREQAWEKAGYTKKPHCDLCGFKSLYPSQIVVYHIDGNLKNTAFTNLRSICLNCVEVVKRKSVNWRRGDLTVDC